MFCSPPSFQLSMKGPPGPVGLTGRPGPVVSKESLWRRGGIPQWRGNPPSNSITSSLFLQGSPWVSWSERRDGRNGATGEIGGMGTGLDGKDLLPEKCYLRTVIKGLRITL